MTWTKKTNCINMKAYKPTGYTVSALIKMLQKIEKTNPRAKVFVPTNGTKEYGYTHAGWCSLESLCIFDSGFDKEYPSVIIGSASEESVWDK